MKQKIPKEFKNGGELDFPVTICLGCGDGGDLIVPAAVTAKEFALLMQCCRDGEEDDIEGYDGLGALYERVAAQAKDENEFCAPEDDDEDEYDDADYMIGMPDLILELIEAESED